MVLGQVNSKPNQMQEAISAYAVISLRQSKWQMWQLICSIGKSRIIHSVGLMLLNTKAFTRIHIVIPNGALKQRDIEDFADYWSLSNFEDRVFYHEDLDFKHGKNDVLLIDESDVLVFDDPLLLKKAFKLSAAICFTATPPSQGQQTLERKIYDHLSLRLCEYWPQVLARPQNARLLKTVEAKDVSDLTTFI